MAFNGKRPAELQINVTSPSNDLPVPINQGAQESDTFSYAAGAYPSRSSLDSPTSLTSFDDVRLTAIPSPGRDPERVPSRYEDSSPLKRSGTALMNVSRKIRRVSVRVVNFAASADPSMRLEDDNESSAGVEELRKTDIPIDSDSIKETPSLINLGPLRGRTLGFLNFDNDLRLSMYRLLIYK